MTKTTELSKELITRIMESDHLTRLVNLFAVPHTKDDLKQEIGMALLLMAPEKVLKLQAASQLEKFVFGVAKRMALSDNSHYNYERRQYEKRRKYLDEMYGSCKQSS